MAATTINPDAEIPARAAAAIAGAIHVASTTLASGRQVHHYEQQPLYTLLAQRNALVDAANALVDPPNEEFDEAAIGYETVERAIRETPAETVDDVVAKMALIAEFVREQGCPDVDDVEAVLNEARSVLTRACDPMRSEKVDRTDAHWVLVPRQAIEFAALDLPANLAAIVAAAEDYDAKFVQPANVRHNALDDAWIIGDENSRKACELAETEWQSHRDVYRTIVDAIFDAKPTTAKQLVAQVETWGALLANGFYRHPKAETLIDKLYEEDAVKVGNHMLASLQRMCGNESVRPTPPIGPAILGTTNGNDDVRSPATVLAGDQAFWDKFAAHRDALARAEAIFEAEGPEASGKDDSAYQAARDIVWDTCIKMLKVPVTTAAAIVQKYFAHQELVHCKDRKHIADMIDEAYDRITLPLDNDADVFRAVIADVRRLADSEIIGLRNDASDIDLIDVIVAEAKEIAKDIGPAQDAFHEANEAWVATKGQGEAGLLARQNELEGVWWSHLNRFSAAAERLFDLPVSATADRARIVRAYADLMAPVFGDTDLDNKLAGLPTENLLEVISYLDGTRSKALDGREEIRAAWLSAKAVHDEKSAWDRAKLLAAE